MSVGRGAATVAMLAGVWASGAGCASAPPSSASPAVLRAEQLLQQTKTQRAGVLRLRCIPSDAEVELDGVPQGRCDDFDGARGLRVGEGLHRIELKKPGYWPYVTYYEASGASALLEATLQALEDKGEER